MRKSALVKYFLPIICLLSLAATVCIAKAQMTDDGMGPERISLDVKDTSLGDVLKMIAERSGYRISINSEHARLPVTVSFHDLPLHEALRRVLGQLNRYVLINDTTRVITFGFVGDAVAAGSRPAAKEYKSYNVLDLEVVPPDKPGGSSMTLREIEAMRQERPEYNMEEVELVPADEPGQKSITAKEIIEREYNPDELEIIPPDTPGEKGLTAKDIEAIKNQRK